MNNDYVIFIPAISIIVITAVIIYIWMTNKTAKLKSVDRASPEINVPIWSSFTGLKRLPRIFSISHNQLYPKLILWKDNISYTVIFSNTKSYKDVELADVYISSFFSKMLIISFKNSKFTFCATIWDTNALTQIIKFLKAKWCPISPEAQTLLNS